MRQHAQMLGHRWQINFLLEIDNIRWIITFVLEGFLDKGVLLILTKHGFIGVEQHIHL